MRTRRGNHRARAWFRSWPPSFPDMAAAVRFLGGSALVRTWLTGLEADDDGTLNPRFDPEVMARVLDHLDRPRWNAWESVTAPTVLVYAEHGMFTAAQQDEFTTRGHEVTRVDLAGAGHDAHLDSPDMWTRAVRAFLHPATTP